MKLLQGAALLALAQTALIFTVTTTVSADADTEVITAAPPPTTTTTIAVTPTEPAPSLAAAIRTARPATPTPVVVIDYSADPDALKAYVARIAERDYGWTGTEWEALDWLIGNESSWIADNANPRSSARGLFQWVGSTATNYGEAWGIHIDHPRTTGVMPPLVDHIDYGLRYIHERYGTPSAAGAFWRSQCGGIYGCYY